LQSQTLKLQQLKTMTMVTTVMVLLSFIVTLLPAISTDWSWLPGQQGAHMPGMTNMDITYRPPSSSPKCGMTIAQLHFGACPQNWSMGW